MKVPLLDLPAQYVEIGPAIEAAVKRVLASGHYIMGEDIAALETELAADARARARDRGVVGDRRACSRRCGRSASGPATR